MRPASAAPALALTKSHVGDFTIGQQGSYTLSVANTGDVATSGTITLVDTLPAGLSYVAASGTGWTCTNAGQSVTCTSTAAIAPSSVGATVGITVSVTTTTPGTLTNSATASGGSATNSASANDPTTIDPAPAALAIAKSHAGDFTVGSTGTYTIVASNPGGTATSGTVTVVDTLPTGLTYNSASGTGWSCGASGQTVTCTSTAAIAAAANANAITLNVNILAAAVPSVTNSATATGGGTTSSPTATDPTTVGGAPVLQANKTHSGNFTSGGTGTYSLSVGNVGTTPTTGTLTYVDTLPAAFTFNAASGTGWACSAAGQIVTCTTTTAIANGGTSSTITLVVNVVGAPGTVSNSATASGGGAAANSTKTNSTTIVSNAPAAGGTKSHAAPDFIVGQNGTYIITPKNTGVQPSTGTITVTDTLPTGMTFVSGTGTDWTCGAAGQLVTCTSPDVIAAASSGNPITLVVAVGAAALPNKTNSATVAIPGGGSYTATDAVTQVDDGARLVASKTHTGNFTDGQNGFWTIGVQNTGSSPTSGTITITDVLQTGLTFVSGVGGNWACSAAGQTVTCTLPDVLAVGQSSSTFALTVAAGPGAVGTFTNTAIPSGGTAAVFVNGTNSTTVNGVPRLGLVKSHSGTFYAGLQATYTLAMNNSTGTAATTGAMTVVDTLPAGLTYVGATGGGWSCGNAGQVVTCTSSLAIAAGASGNPITVTVTPQPAAVPSVTNSATFSGGGASASATATDPTTVAIAPVLGISKSHSGNFTAGLNGTYTITPINSGFQATSGAYSIVDNLPAGLTYVGATGPGWSCADSGATVTCTSSTVIAASSIGQPITLVVAVAASAVPSVTNTANSSGGGAPNTGSASDLTTVTIPVLGLTKTHTGSFVVGQNGTYTLTAKDTGNATTFGTTTVSDTLPAGLTFVSAAGSGWTCGATAGVVTCTSSAAIAAGASFPAITLVVGVPVGTTPGSVTNDASASGGGATNTATATDPTTLAQPALAISKTHTGTFPVGGTGAYAIAVSNTGDGATFGTTTVTDTLPAGLTYVSAAGTGWTCGAAAQVVTCTSSTAVAAAGAFPAITLNVTVPAGTLPGSVTNSVIVSGGGAANSPTATDPTTIAGASSLALAKSHTGSFVAGQTGTYTLTVSNAGNVATAGTITVTDTLPAGLTYNAAAGTGWTCGAAGQVVTCTSAAVIAVSASGTPISLTVNALAAAVPQVTNGASASGGGASAPATATDPTTVTQPVLAIAKTHTGNFAIGATGSYAIAVSNTGTSATFGTITVTDTLPAGLTFSAASGTGWTCSGAAQTATCTSTTSIAAAGTGNPIALVVNVTGAPGTVTNSVTASGGGAANSPTATDPTTIAGAMSIALAKSHTGSFVAGQTGTYALTVSNAGNVATAGTITVTDTLPAGLSFNAAAGTGWTCAAAGQIVTCTSAAVIAAHANGNPIALTVNVSNGAPATLTNSATASGGGAPNTPVATDPTTISGTPSLALAKSHAGSFVAGQSGTYAIAVSNSGTAATTGTITVTDTLPTGLSFSAASGTGWTCSGSAQSATCTSTTAIAANASGNPIALTVNIAANAPGTLTNVASVSGGGASNVPGASDATTILHPALTIAKSHAGNFTVGSTGTYTILAGNNGTAATFGAIALIDTLPPGLTFGAASGNGWTCAATGVAITCTSLTPIAAGGTAPPLTVSVNVLAAAVPQVVNTATVSGGGATVAPVATDPTVVTGTTVLSGLAGPQIDKFVNSVRSVAAAPGSSVTYSIGFQNSGNAAASNVVLSDAFPSGVTPVLSSVTLNGVPSGFTASLSGQTLTVAIPSVPATARETIAVGANVANAAGPARTAINVASLSASGIAALQTTQATVFNGSSNIVYDGTKGASAPIGGATIALVDAVSGKAIALGAPTLAANAAPSVNPQTTAANGTFAFPLGPAQFGAPNGSETYRLTLAARGFRNRSIQAVFSAVPGGLLYSVTLTALDGQELAVEGGFSLVSRPTTIADVLNIISNIPMFPAGALTVQKQADRTTVSTGDRVVYTVSVVASQSFGPTRIVDQLPAGLAYAPHTGTLDGTALEPVSSGLTQIWQLRSLDDGTHVLRYDAVVGAGASQNSKLTNVADVTASLAGGGTTSGSAAATVQTVAGAFSDRLTVLGRVVIGSADGGWTSVSRGVAGVRLIMEDGTTVVTDAQGRYSLQEVRPGAHVLRLDESSLPAGVTAFGTHAYNDPRSTVRLIHTVMDTRLLQDVIFVVQAQP